MEHARAAAEPAGKSTAVILERSYNSDDYNNPSRTASTLSHGRFTVLIGNQLSAAGFLVWRQPFFLIVLPHARMLPGK